MNPRNPAALFAYVLAGGIAMPAWSPASANTPPSTIDPAAEVAPRWLIKISGDGEARTAELNAVPGIQKARRIGGEWYVVSVEPGIEDAQARQALTAHPGVEAVESDTRGSYLSTEIPNDPYFADLPDDGQIGTLDDIYPTCMWGLHNRWLDRCLDDDGEPVIGPDVGALEAWVYTKGSMDVVVAVIDSGIDFSNPDLGPHAWHHPTDPSIVGGYRVNGVDEPTSLCEPGDPSLPYTGLEWCIDRWNHGTQMAGIVAARGNDGFGITGVAQEATLLGIAITLGAPALVDVVEGIYLAVDLGADVMNLSLGFPDESEALNDAIQYALDRDATIVAAAGNSSNDSDETPMFPAALPGVIGVAAIDRLGDLASFSNWGETTIDLAAPGVHSLGPVGRKVINEYGDYHHYYLHGSGTSNAAPHVVGAVVLLKSLFPDDFSNAEIRDILMTSTQKLTSLEGKVRSGGTLRADLAIEEAIRRIERGAPSESARAAAPD